MDDLLKIRKQGIKYTVKTVDESDFDYSKDEAWQRLKSESSKAYRKLKQREFELRHKI
jgi:hypothetical protein